MITAAIRALNEKTGSSRHAIYKWIQANHHIDEKKISQHGNLAIRTALKNGNLKTGKSSAVFKVGDKQKETEKAQAAKAKKAAKAAVAKTEKAAKPKAAKPAAAAKKAVATKSPSAKASAAKKVVKKAAAKKS